MNIATTACLFALLAALPSSRPNPAPDPARGTVPDEGDEIYQRAMDRVLAKAQDQLQQATKLREVRTWANAWQVPSKHYTVRAVESYAMAKSLGGAMDQMAPIIQGLIKPDFQWPAPMPVWVVPDIATYNQIGNAGGDAHSSIYESHYTVGQNNPPVVVLHDANETSLRVRATHSAVHQFIAQAYPNTPRRGPATSGAKRGVH